jgi:hypothetical protein
MLLGALGVAIPVVIHLIDRQRAPVVKFAALDFLVGSDRKLARRMRLRELLLLIIRALACLLIPLALAKPFTSCTATGPEVERGPQAAVLVIDNSFASAYQIGDSTLLSRAKSQARSILDQLGPEADVAVLLAAEGSRSPSELSRDHVRLRDTIAELRSSARPAATTTALKRAAQLLRASNHERRTVFLLSLLARNGFRPDDPPWPKDSGPHLTIVDLAEGARLDNTAITDLLVEADPSSGSRGVRVTAEIANFGATPVDGRGINLRIGDRIVSRGTISLRPGERQKKHFLASLPHRTRSTDVVIELDHDALRVDDRRYVRAQLREEVRVLLVNGDPRTVRYDDELFYLAAALRPGDRGDSGTTLTSTTVDELPRAKIDEVDVIVLANVRALAPDQVKRLESWVRAGGGLMVTLGKNVDPDGYNKTMQPLLPQQLKSRLDVGYGARGKERRGRSLRLTKLDHNHAVFSIFSKDAPALREARFSGIMLLGPTTRVDDRRVLARYTNGAAAMVEARVGKGRLFLFTSSIDRDWNDLSIHPGYLPLVQQTVRYLARKQSQRDAGQVLVGRSRSIRVVAGDSRIEIRPPRGPRTVIEGDALADRKQVRFTKTDYPGFYRVVTTDRKDDTRPRPESDFAANLDPRGSDLHPAAASALPTSGHAGIAKASTTHKRRVELWHALAVGLLMLLLIESVLVLR